MDYYFKHFEGFNKKVVQKLEDGTFEKSLLVFLESNFNDLASTIQKLQSQDTYMSNWMETMQAISEKKYLGPVGVKIQAKVKGVLERNFGWLDMQNIAAVLGVKEMNGPYKTY